MQRFFFTLIQSMKARAKLQACTCAATVLAIDLKAWQQAGVLTLILDFDGVLNSHGEDQLTSVIIAWLNNCVKLFKVYILSNKPTKARQQYFARHFPQITFIVAEQKKPYPAGILQICQLSGNIGRQVLIIDDRLLTGILAGCLAGINTLFIQAPLVNFQRRILSELFFLSLRVLERIYLGFSLNDVCGYRKLHKM
jgi:predicted HAD superfamily phosphohydrolase YqeG